MDSVRDRLARGAAWLMGARVLSNLAAFAGTLILARLLAPEDFGLVAIAVTVTTIVSAFTELSVMAALIHLRDVEEDHFHTAWTLSLIRGVVVAVLVGALSWPLAAIYGDPRLIPIMLSLAGVGVCWSIYNPKMTVYTRELVFWQDALVGLSQKLATLLASVAVAYVFRSYWAIVAGQAAAAATLVVMSYAFMPFRPRFRFHDVRRMFSYSAWLSLGSLVGSLNARVDPLFIGYVSGNTALGHYSVGDNLAALPTREVLSPLSSTLFPGFTKVADDPDGLRAAFLRAQSLLSVLSFPAGFGLALIAEPLVHVALGERWAPAIPIIQLLAGVFALQTLGVPLGPLAMAMGATRALFNREVVIFAVRMPLVVAGLALGGLMGAVVGRSLGGLIATILAMTLARRLIAVPLRAQLQANRRTILATLAMIAGVLAGPAVLGAPDGLALPTIVATVLGGAAIYTTTLLVAWRAAGWPDGPERDLLQVAGRLVPGLSRLAERP